MTVGAAWPRRPEWAELLEGCTPADNTTNNFVLADYKQSNLIFSCCTCACACASTSCLLEPQWLLARAVVPLLASSLVYTTTARGPAVLTPASRLMGIFQVSATRPYCRCARQSHHIAPAFSQGLGKQPTGCTEGNCILVSDLIEVNSNIILPVKANLGRDHCRVVK